jgi:hypothetical protein
MLGLVRFRHPVCLRAPVSFVDPTGVSVPGTAVPWSAVNPDIVESCSQSGSDPDFVMTVENWTSFNGQCREISRGAVVYTSGLPSYPFQDFRSSNNRYGWHEEDAQAAFDERAALLESDQGMPREDADALLWRQLEAERKRWMQ